MTVSTKRALDATVETIQPLSRLMAHWLQQNNHTSVSWVRILESDLCGVVQMVLCDVCK